MATAEHEQVPRGASPSRSNRDTFGSAEMEGLVQRTNTMTVVDGMPVSHTVGLGSKSTNTMPVVDGMPVSQTVDLDSKNAAGVNGVAGASGVGGTGGAGGVNPVNGHLRDISNTSHIPNNANIESSPPPLSVPLLAVTGPEGAAAAGNGRTESPALFMPGGPPVNMPVPQQQQQQRPPLPQQTSRSYISARPVVVTQYERPLDDVQLSPPLPRTTATEQETAAAASPKRPARAPGTNSRKKEPKNAQVAAVAKEHPPMEIGKQDVNAVPQPQQTTPLPTQVALPVPTPMPAPALPASKRASVEDTGAASLHDHDPDDYDRVRASFYSVPDPTRPETAHTYRQEIAHNYPDESMASVGVNAPDSTASPMAPAPRAMPQTETTRPQTATTGAVHAGQTQNAPAQVQRSHSERGRPRPQSMGAMAISEPIPIKVYDHDAGRAAANANQARSQGHLTASASTSRRSSHARGMSPTGHQRLPPIQDGVMVGDVVPFERQQQLQTTGSGTHTPPRHQLVDRGVVTPPGDRGARSHSALNRHSSFGARPHPVLIEDQPAGHGGQAGFFAPDHRTGLVGRSNTSHSRATTLGRTGTLSRASNGGTVGRRAGGFGMGAGLSVGTQPEEILGRQDIHSRADVSERQLDRATLSRLSRMEKKDAKKLEKLMKEEERAQARAVEQSIRDLKSLTAMQREALGNERKSQARLSKWTAREHKARMRFLKEKERYEKIEAELRNAENDFEERRDHAAGLTAQIAERTQEIDDLRAQKAADDRERRVKKLAMRNPAYA